MNENSIVKFQPDQQQIETIKNTICATATQPEFEMFLEVCKGTGLNPFLNEIWFIKMPVTEWNEKTKKREPTGEFKVNMFAARDGYLKIANNHPQYDGMECPVERDEKTKAPICATATVYRKDRSHPATFTAMFSEYRKETKFWRDNPSAAIQKVAEAGALKRAFAISGLLTLEEFGASSIKEAQDILSKETVPAAEQTERATVKECEEVTKRMKWEDINVILDKHKVSSLRELPRQAVLDMIAGLTPEPANVVEVDYEVVNEGNGSETGPKAEGNEAIKPAAADSLPKDNRGFYTPDPDKASSPPPAQAAQPAGAPKKSAKPAKDDGTFYTCEPNKVLDKWNVYKFNSQKAMLATYHVERDMSACDCPSRKQPCKHVLFVKDYKQSEEYSAKYGPKKVATVGNDKSKYREIQVAKGYEIAVSEYLKDKLGLGLAVIFDYMAKKMRVSVETLKPAHWQLVYDVMFDITQDEIDKTLGYKKPEEKPNV